MFAKGLKIYKTWWTLENHKVQERYIHKTNEFLTLPMNHLNYNI